MRFFSEKSSIFTAKISDLFLVIAQVLGFSLYFLRCFVSFTMYYSQEQPLFQKRIPLSHLFLLCSYFRAHPTTLLLKILGGRMHGPSPNSNLGAVPPVPLGLRPCTVVEFNHMPAII